MKDRVYYWIMQVIGGQTVAHGPYLTEQGRDNRMDKVFGGEVTPFKSFEKDAEKAIDDFKVEQLEVRAGGCIR